MSQVHGIFPTTQLPPAPTWAAGFGSRFSLMPSCAAFDWSWAIIAAIHWTPVAYGKLKLRVLPAAIPGPHLAGSTQLLTPPGTTFQPWLVSRLLALAGLYGNGPMPEPTCALPVGDRNWVAGVLPTGPTVGVPYPRSGPLITAAWLVR